MKLKNPDIRIVTANIEYSPLDKEEFKKQIPEMLKQKLIQKSESPHRTAAFIVRNHSEIKRGKARIVYNYKRLNDNTIDDGYNIPNNEQIINKNINEQNIQEQVDDMLIECMTDLSMTYEEAYKTLENYFNLPLVSSIINGETLIRDFYKKESNFMDYLVTPSKRAKPEFVVLLYNGPANLLKFGMNFLA